MKSLGKATPQTSQTEPLDGEDRTTSKLPKVGRIITVDWLIIFKIKKDQLLSNCLQTSQSW